MERSVNELARHKRIFTTLDGIRGLAAVLVLIRHVPYFGPLWFQETYLAVDLFFILSGVVIANAYQHKLGKTMSVGQFVWMRIVRIHPLYLLGSAITLLYWLVIGKSEEGNTAAIILFALLMFPNLTSNKSFPLNGPAWSLFSEMIANIVYALIAHRLTIRLLGLIMGVSLAGIVAIIVRHGNLDYGYYTHDIWFGLCRVGFSFFAGVLIYRLYAAAPRLHHVAFKGQALLPWLLLLGLLLIFIRSPYGLKNMVYDFVVVAFVFPVTILLGMVFHPDRFSASIFRFFGLVSYPMYVLHVPLSKWIPVLFAGQEAMLLTHPLWLGVSFLVIVMVLGWLLDRYYDLPLRRIGLTFGEACRTRMGWSVKNVT